MSSVGSTLKAEGVEQQLLLATAAAASRAQAASTPTLSSDEASISSAGRLRGSTMVVRDVIQSLSQDAVWQARQVQSTAPQAVQASSDGGPIGSHQVHVEALATAQVTSTASFSSLSTVIGIGTLNIEMGQWGGSASTFATNPNWPKANVSMGPQDNTLERVRDRINAAGVGVIAAVVSDATGSRLVLSATSTGADNGFRIQTTPADATEPQDSPLSFDLAQGDAGQGMQLLQPAQDARLSLNQRPLRSDSNLLDDAETGLRLNLKATTNAAARLDVSEDDDVVQRRLQSLAASGQDLQQQLQRPDASPGASGGDARQDARQLLDTLKAELTGPDAGAWRAIGLRWDAQAGLQQQPPSWTPALRQSGQALFAALASKLPDAERVRQPASPMATSPMATSPMAAPPAAAAPAPSASDSAPPGQPFTAAVQRNRQRLMDQYAMPAAAPEDSGRQDLAIS